MASVSGSIVLGDPRNVPGGGTPLPDSFSKVIQNPYQGETLLIENRQSVALNIQPVVGAVAGSSTGAGRPGAGGISVPALSLASVPIDPDADVTVSIARAPEIAMETRQVGNLETVAVGIPGPRNIPYTILPGNSGFHVDELYPLRDCLTVTIRGNIAAGGGQQINVVDFGSFTRPTGVNILQNANAAAVAYPSRPWPNAPNNLDPVFMAVLVVIESLGASSSADDLIMSVTNHLQTIGFPEDGVSEMEVLSRSAAGATGIISNSGIIPIPGAQSIEFTNQGATSAIAYRATYWVGVPHDSPTG